MENPGYRANSARPPSSQVGGRPAVCSPDRQPVGSTPVYSGVTQRSWFGVGLASFFMVVLCLLDSKVRAQNSPSQTRSEQAHKLAKQLSDEASQAFERRDFARSQTLLEASYLLYPSEKFQFSLGRVYEATGQKLLAMRAFQQFLRKVPLQNRSPGQTEDSTFAIGKLKRDLGHLVFSQPLSGPAQIDDETEVPQGSLDAWVLPGAHRLVLPHDIEQVTVGAGETRNIQVSSETSSAIVQSDAGGTIKETPRRNKNAALAPAKWTLGALGVISLSTGAVLMGINGLRSCSDFPASCADPLATKWPGVGLLAGGSAAVLTSIVLFAVDRKNK